MLRALGATAALAWPAPVARAAQLLATPYQGEGPFYPLELPLDQDNDLTRVAGRSGHAKGTIVDVGGRLLDEAGRPLTGVQIEIWQVNALRPLPPSLRRPGQAVGPGLPGLRSHRDRTPTAPTASAPSGPVAYPGRAPHIHFALSDRRFATFYTQMYVAGAPDNDRDFLLGQVRDARARNSLIVNLEPSPAEGSELVGRFDIVLGETVLSRKP